LEHRASNPVSVKNLTAIETSTIVKLLRPYVPVGTKRTSSKVYTLLHQRLVSRCAAIRWCFETTLGFLNV
jgi:hypothetical protein